MAVIVHFHVFHDLHAFHAFHLFALRERARDKLARWSQAGSVGGGVFGRLYARGQLLTAPINGDLRTGPDSDAPAKCR